MKKAVLKIATERGRFCDVLQAKEACYSTDGCVVYSSIPHT